MTQPVQLRDVLHFAPPGLVQCGPEDTPLHAVKAPFILAGIGQESQFAGLAHNPVAQAVEGLDLYPFHAPPLQIAFDSVCRVPVEGGRQNLPRTKESLAHQPLDARRHRRRLARARGGKDQGRSPVVGDDELLLGGQGGHK